MRRQSLACGLSMFAAALLTACPQPAPVPPPPFDASDSAPPEPIGDATPTPPPPVTACSPGCSALAAAGCPIGAHPDCPVVLQRDLSIGKVSNPSTGRPLTCNDVAAVKTRADAIKLGFTCQ